MLAKAPLSRYVALSSSTPVGWLFLVRLAPFGRDGTRLVTLLFACGDVVMAYVVARSLPWRSVAVARFAATLTAALVVLAPISLVRNDLKQYTSDAFFALVVVFLLLRVEAAPSRRRLAALSIGAVIAVGFSTVSAFITAAGFSALVITELTARPSDGPTDRSYGRDVLVASAATLVALALYFVAVVIPHDNRALRDYWRAYYLTGGPVHEIADTWDRLGHVSVTLGGPGSALVVLVALTLGVTVLMRLGRTTLALVVPLVWIEMMVAGVARRYPFLDQRTSHFLLVFSLTVIGVGIAGAIVAVAGRSRVLAVVVTLVVALGFAYRAEPYLRTHSIPDEDVRSQVAYVAGHRAPADVVVVSLMSSYGVGYYWPGAKNTFAVDTTGNNSNGYTTRVSNIAGIVYATGRQVADTTAVMQRAMALARTRGTRVRIWIIRTHVSTGEGAAWARSFRALRLHLALVPVGVEPLAVIAFGDPG